MNDYRTTPVSTQPRYAVYDNRGALGKPICETNEIHIAERRMTMLNKRAHESRKPYFVLDRLNLYVINDNKKQRDEIIERIATGRCSVV